jgi:hypothetical protein
MTFFKQLISYSAFFGSLLIYVKRILLDMTVVKIKKWGFPYKNSLPSLNKIHLGKLFENVKKSGIRNKKKKKKPGIYVFYYRHHSEAMTKVFKT